MVPFMVERHMDGAVLAVGHELLLGHTADDNAAWLGARFTEAGGVMGRFAVCDDDTAAIAEEVARLVGMGPSIMFTTGGLGPTWDDITLGGVAQGLGLEVEEDGAALEMIRANYEREARRGNVADPALTHDRAKMARLPAGSTPLPNAVGSAPGVRIEAGSTTIFCLPGVPEEMKSIFEESALPAIRDRFEGREIVQREFEVAGTDESTLAPYLVAARAEFPDVWIKSRVRVMGSGFAIRICLEGPAGTRVEAARAWLEPRLRG